MEHINQAVQSIDQRVVAHGIALQALISCLGPAARQTISYYAEQALVQGLRTTLADTHIDGIRKHLKTLLETGPR